MRILICLKQVPDTTEVKLTGDLTLEREFVAQVLNPADESALELGLELKEKHGGTVTVLTMGPKRAEGMLREALSRGAEHCTFVDQRKDAVKLVRENLEATGLTERAKVVQGDSLSFLSGTREKYHLIFLDPPYDANLLETTLNRIAGIDILAENGIIICESRVNQDLPELPNPYRKSRDYKYGKIKVTLYRKECDSQ